MAGQKSLTSELNKSILIFHRETTKRNQNDQFDWVKFINDFGREWNWNGNSRRQNVRGEHGVMLKNDKDGFE